MHAITLLLAVNSVGVDYGWEPNSAGELEYIIQIEPDLLNALQSGNEITSRIDPQVKGVQRFRIRVGTGVVPRRGASLAATSELPRPPSMLSPPKPGETGLGAPPSVSLPADKGFPAPPEKNNGGGAFPASDFPAPPTNPNRTDFPAPPGGGFQPQQPIRPPVEADDGKESPLPDPDQQGMLTPPLPLPSNVAPATHAQAVDSKPLATQTAAELPKSDQSAEIASPSYVNALAAAPEPEAEPSRPWLVLVLVALLLFASIGLNIYLGWIARGLFQRFRNLSQEFYENQVETV